MMTTQREGWLGEEYVRVYAESDRSRVTRLYDFPGYLPGYEPWGSWGLDALCLGPDSRLYAIDWIPLEERFKRERYASINVFEEDIARLLESTPLYQHFQKEIHFVKPLVFGGDPLQTPVMIDQDTHSQFCRFWNQTYARLKNPVAR